MLGYKVGNVCALFALLVFHTPSSVDGHGYLKVRVYAHLHNNSFTSLHIESQTHHVHSISSLQIIATNNNTITYRHHAHVTSTHTTSSPPVNVLAWQVVHPVNTVNTVSIPTRECVAYRPAG